MASGGRKSKLTDQQWAELGGRYEGGATISELSRDYGISRKAIQKAIEKHGWKQDIRKIVDQRVAEKEIGLVPASSEKRNEQINVAVDAIVALKQKHKDEWATVEDLISDALAQRKPGVKPDGTPVIPSFEPFKQAKIIAETLAIKQMGERKAWGLEDKTKIEHSGPGGGAIQTETTFRPDLSKLTPDDLLALRSVTGKLASQRPA